MVINETNDSNDGSVCTHPMGVGMCAYKIRMRYKCISLPMAGRWKRIRLQRNRDLLMRDQRVDYYNNNPGLQSCWIPMIPFSWLPSKNKNYISFAKGMRENNDRAQIRNCGFDASKEVCALNCELYSWTVRASLGYVFTHSLSMRAVLLKYVQGM